MYYGNLFIKLIPFKGPIKIFGEGLVGLKNLTTTTEGEEVLMFGAPATDGPDGKAIQASFDAFEEETGIIVTYVGSENFESEVQEQPYFHYQNGYQLEQNRGKRS